MGQTYNELIRTVTEDYLGGIDMDSIPSSEPLRMSCSKPPTTPLRGTTSVLVTKMPQSAQN